MEILASNNENIDIGDNGNFFLKKKMKIGFEDEIKINNVLKKENPEEKMKFLFPSLASEVRLFIFYYFQKINEILKNAENNIEKGIELINKISKQEKNEQNNFTGKNIHRLRRNLKSSLKLKNNIPENNNINTNTFQKENEIPINQKDDNSEDSKMENLNNQQEDLMNVENKEENKKEEEKLKKKNNIIQIPKQEEIIINNIKDNNIQNNNQEIEKSKIEIPEHLEREYEILLEIIKTKDKNKFEQFLQFKKYFEPTPKSDEIDKKAKILKQVLLENIYLKNSISSNTESSLDLNKENGILESKLDEMIWKIGHFNEVLSEQKIKTMELKDKLSEFENSNNNLYISNQGLA